MLAKCDRETIDQHNNLTSIHCISIAFSFYPETSFYPTIINALGMQHTNYMHIPEQTIYLKPVKTSADLKLQHSFANILFQHELIGCHSWMGLSTPTIVVQELKNI